MESSQKKQQANKGSKKANGMPLAKSNYLIISAGALVIAGSFWGMSIERQVDGFFALNVAPFLIIGAYLAIGFGILYRPEKDMPVNRSGSVS